MHKTALSLLFLLSACSTHTPKAQTQAPKPLKALKTPKPTPTALTAGLSHTCALYQQRVTCWGEGWPTDTPEQAARTPLTNLHNVKTLTAGSEHTCALLQQGEVWCWGRDIQRQTGKNSPQKMTLPEPVIKLQATNKLTCALLQHGDLWCWGRIEDFNPITGLSTPFSSDTPKHLPGPPGVALTMLHGPCLLHKDQKISCWELQRQPKPTLQRQNIPAAPQNTKNLITGDVLCALSTDGTLSCLHEGQWKVRALKIKDFAQGGAGQCTLTQNEDLHCQGFSDQAHKLSNIERFTIGALHFCAMDSQHKITCWGTSHITTKVIKEDLR